MSPLQDPLQVQEHGKLMSRLSAGLQLQKEQTVFYETAYRIGQNKLLFDQLQT